MTDTKDAGNATINISLEPEVVGSSSTAKPITINLNDDVKHDVSKAAASAGVAYFAESAKNGVAEFRTYVMENPAKLKTLGLLIGTALFVFSTLGMINVLGLIHPIEYIVNFFNLIFGAAIIIMEGKETWGFFGLREKLFANFKILALPAGRAAFYFYVGVIVLGILPESLFWKIIYIVLGSACCISGMFQLALAWKNRGDTVPHMSMQEEGDVEKI